MEQVPAVLSPAVLSPVPPYPSGYPSGYCFSSSHDRNLEYELVLVPEIGTAREAEQPSERPFDGQSHRLRNDHEKIPPEIEPLVSGQLNP